MIYVNKKTKAEISTNGEIKGENWELKTKQSKKKDEKGKADE